MKALIGMSGGVDSSVAALLMKEQGCDCIGATMRLYAGQTAAPDGSKTCCSLDDVEDARRCGAGGWKSPTMFLISLTTSIGRLWINSLTPTMPAERPTPASTATVF